VIDLTIRPREQSRDVVLKVVHETFDDVLDLGDSDTPAPVLDEEVTLARAACERNDVVELDDHLAKVATAAIVGRAQLRADNPDLGGRS
jgi:hypothetical protein